MLNVLLEDARSSMFFMYHLFKHNYEIINIIMKLFHRVSLVKMNSGKPVVIGYWNARGLIQPIKLILEHLKIPYTVDIPKCGPAPYFSAEEFKHKKYESLKEFDFPNLPYFDDGERKLTHLFAIMEYIGMKNGLYPTEERIIDCSLIREQIKDIMALEIDYIYFYDHRKKVMTFYDIFCCYFRNCSNILVIFFINNFG